MGYQPGCRTTLAVPHHKVQRYMQGLAAVADAAGPGLNRGAGIWLLKPCSLYTVWPAEPVSTVCGLCAAQKGARQRCGACPRSHRKASLGAHSRRLPSVARCVGLLGTAATPTSAILYVMKPRIPVSTWRICTLHKQRLRQDCQFLSLLGHSQN